MPGLASALLIAISCLLLPAAGFAQDKSGLPMQGIWRFEKDSTNAPSLSFVRDGKVMFLVRAGRTISIWFAWPEGPQTKGPVRVRIETGGRKPWRLDGDLTTEDQGGKPAIYFMQNDMGMSDRKKKWGNLTQRYNQFIDALTAASEIVITTKQGVLRLPPVSIPDARKEMQL
ncbi:hypothetical protein [Pseudorhodoplanes sp.]|uniref:hypothetical protein n=1 Tax=Pseudorhodoplanes sp. TaxID=1934341 RepID=UPI002B7DACB4|nr:hypothetical protein [Pseudorhodoplanes sp.]HWV54253.1 hypothetical protein [Pseudorhodoplanes sp.]